MCLPTEGFPVQPEGWGMLFSPFSQLVSCVFLLQWDLGPSFRRTDQWHLSVGIGRTPLDSIKATIPCFSFKWRTTLITNFLMSHLLFSYWLKHNQLKSIFTYLVPSNLRIHCFDSIRWFVTYLSLFLPLFHYTQVLFLQYLPISTREDDLALVLSIIQYICSHT